MRQKGRREGRLRMENNGRCIKRRAKRKNGRRQTKEKLREGTSRRQSGG